ncbi:MAG: hydroxymethylbilane synthase [Halobacteriaceae archaeon]
MDDPDEPLRIATRGSRLARRQARTVAGALEDHHYAVELVEVETEGDRIRDERIADLGRKGAFVRSLDDRVLDGEVDLAVHSLKDLPTDWPPDLVAAAVPERAAPGDVLVTPDGTPLSDLPAGATVGTSSTRRRAQVLSARPDLTVEPLRGNVDTRVEKLLAPHLQAEHQRRLAAADEEPADATDGGQPTDTADEDQPAEAADGDAGGADGTDEPPAEEYDRSPAEWFERLNELERQAMQREVEETYDAIVLARAGLDRLGLADAVPVERLPAGEFVPSPGQGAVAVTGRVDDPATEAVRTALDHPRTRVETTAERTVLEAVGGGCVSPIGVYAVVQGTAVHVQAGVYGPDGDRSVTASRDLPVEEYADAARDLADDLLADGADALIEGGDGGAG